MRYSRVGGSKNNYDDRIIGMSLTFPVAKAEKPTTPKPKNKPRINDMICIVFKRRMLVFQEKQNIFLSENKFSLGIRT